MRERVFEQACKRAHTRENLFKGRATTQMCLIQREMTKFVKRAYVF